MKCREKIRKKSGTFEKVKTRSGTEKRFQFLFQFQFQFFNPVWLERRRPEQEDRVSKNYIS